VPRGAASCGGGAGDGNGDGVSLSLVKSSTSDDPHRAHRHMDALFRAPQSQVQNVPADGATARADRPCCCCGGGGSPTCGRPNLGTAGDVVAHSTQCRADAGFCTPHEHAHGRRSGVPRVADAGAVVGVVVVVLSRAPGGTSTPAALWAPSRPCPAGVLRVRDAAATGFVRRFLSRRSGRAGG